MTIIYETVFHCLVPLAQEGYFSPRTYAKQVSEIWGGGTNHVYIYETLEDRRNRARLMETYKYLNNYYNTPPERFFKKNGERTRGHSQKQLKKRAWLDQNNNFFPVKIVGKWNDLPTKVVEAATIGSFKRRLMNHRRSLVTS